ncbi:hypothetical protein AN958_00826 [Leucoagaricus sp. SymC.cos]|nr:hypothetical protein AN958_00826 [Leucoagaricus sp. SymC.cos]
MRIRCPDTSPSNSFAFVPTPNPTSNPVAKRRPPKTLVAVPTLRRSSSSLRRREQIPGKLKRTDSASLAAKKEQRRGDTRFKTDRKRQYSFVYAGNLKATITEDQLRARFSACGPIIRIVIRCSSGQPQMTFGEGKPRAMVGPRDRKYASIEFRDSMGYLRALQLNGQLLDGVEMIVCTSAADLPEAKQTVCTPTGRSAPAQPPRIPHSPNNSPAINSPYRTPAPIPIDIPMVPNEKLGWNSKPPDGPAPTEGDRFRFLGLSFAKCII